MRAKRFKTELLEQKALEYHSWDKFKRVLDKARVACQASGVSVDDHFSQVGNMVEIGFGATSGLAKGELIIKDSMASTLGIGKKFKKIRVRHLI